MFNHNSFVILVESVKIIIITIVITTTTTTTTIIIIIILELLRPIFLEPEIPFLVPAHLHFHVAFILLLDLKFFQLISHFKC